MNLSHRDTTVNAHEPGWLDHWNRFWFAPTDPVALHRLRLLMGGLVFFWLLGFAGQLTSLFGPHGWIDQQAWSELYALPMERQPPYFWSPIHLATTNAAVWGLYAVSLVSVLLFTLGIATRITGVLTWLSVITFTGNPITLYEGEELLLVVTFYLMLGYLFAGLRRPGLSKRERVLGSDDAAAWRWLQRDDSLTRFRSTAVTIALRLFQIHLAVIVMTTGLHKLQKHAWWNGAAFWFPLHPPFETQMDDVLAIEHPTAYLAFWSLIAYGVLAYQISFPFLIWRRGWQRLMTLGAAIGWIGTAFIYHLPIFGPFLFFGTFAYRMTSRLNPGSSVVHRH